MKPILLPYRITKANIWDGAFDGLRFIGDIQVMERDGRVKCSEVHISWKLYQEHFTPLQELNGIPIRIIGKPKQKP